MGVGKNTMNTILGEIGKYQESINKGVVYPDKPETQSIKQQQALYPDFKFGPERPGPDYTVSSTGVKKGDQVTKTVPVKAPKAISGGTPGSAWDNKMKSLLAGGTSYEELAKKGHGTVEGLKKRFPDAYKPKTITTSTPDQEVTVTATIPRDADQSNENDGSSASDTTPDTTGDTTDDTIPPGKAGPMQPALVKPTGTGGNTKMNRPTVSADPTLASSGSSSTPKDYEITLNQQAVNKV